MDEARMRWIEEKLGREARLLLFQQLHQDDDPEWRRGSGATLYRLCGLAYRYHYLFDDTSHTREPTDHRLCNGNVVHLSHGWLVSVMGVLVSNKNKKWPSLSEGHFVVLTAVRSSTSGCRSFGVLDGDSSTTAVGVRARKLFSAYVARAGGSL